MTSSQRNIEKARELYLTKGVLKRELLRDEIVYSWVRSRLINLDSSKPPTPSLPLEIDLNGPNIVSLFHLKDLGFSKIEKQIVAVLLLSETGEILNAWSDSPVNRLYFNFSEDAIGTSGIGMAIKSNEKSYAVGHENYHDYLVNYITVGIPTSGKMTLGLIVKNASEATSELGFITRLPERIEASDLKMSNKNDLKETPIDDEMDQVQIQLPACLAGTSEAIQAARDRIDQFKDGQLIFISGPKGIGKESVANYLHQVNYGEESKFHAVYCDKMPLKRFESEWLENSDNIKRTLEVYEIGTVYFENFNALPGKYQHKLLRILDSKLVNSNSENSWYNSDVTFILSLTKGVDETLSESRLTHALQSRLKLAEIRLPGLTRRKNDICSILGHMIRDEIESKEAMYKIEESTLFEAVKELYLPDNLRDLDHIARRVIEKVTVNGTVTDACIDDILSKYNREEAEPMVLKCLSQIEKEAIENTLKALNFNMVRTASTLGISRSTLYRKLEQHKIDIESVR